MRTLEETIKKQEQTIIKMKQEIKAREDIIKKLKARLERKRK